MGQLSMDVYIKQLKKRYKKLQEIRKGIILDESFVRQVDITAHHAIRLLNPTDL